MIIFLLILTSKEFPIKAILPFVYTLTLFHSKVNKYTKIVLQYLFGQIKLIKLRTYFLNTEII